MAKLVFLDFPSQEVSLLEDAATKLDILDQCEFHLSDSVENAIQELKNEKMGSSGPDVVFLNGDGEKLLLHVEALKEDPKSRKNPLVILGHKSDSEFVMNLYERGINSFVQKPDSFSEMVRVADIVLTYWRRITQLPSRIVD